MGARATGMGYASSCLTDEWSVFNNIAGLSKLDMLRAACTYDAQPNFKPFNKAAAVIAMPLTIGVAGIGCYRFGDDIYNEHIISAGYSTSFGLASLGIKLNYIQYNAQGFGKKGVVSVSFGGIAELTPQLKVGAHIINLNQPSISTIDGERLPTILIAGIALKLSERTTITSELEKDLDFKPTWKTGAEQTIHKKFLLRTGFNIHPGAAFFGFGFRHRKFSCDYALQYRPSIGSRHQASVCFKFKDQTK
jgi:hypothetical protein